ncbi:hypothetical protein A2303_02465 [Candidatus Falkowbacteria bacterium RIFOXYB2_FULL_47_14]|uniref:Uncharacterized protein n=1 Tax=Candidatus Falkowbacteria bacterium RIFOXYA2_FULL_47_19 TaxID=1797994 RepID=A0A1F5SEQ1_9BACT|nr:MAG: hypothetical protein A2227_07645 [Candidatus Falkowbacteria bacterium RIFOXYA2_FULL_47_19]OGF35938.1 MAG: hypothetical protein A2468_01860 [Candidatus Falkowbacteria bacterium RIFOXYC2_FULL_46_15]OGF43924.1 MAG: hypothetical protein A2303_02465 [Candidatus Falkowbacteria bacterium RIFOXYB2_FULL_47_14]
METNNWPLKKEMSRKAKFFVLWGGAFVASVIVYFIELVTGYSNFSIREILWLFFQTILRNIDICLISALIPATIASLIKINNKKIQIALQITVILIFSYFLFKFIRALYGTY